jgi:glutathione synthase/RimK-type ligase-like ATP-grasp enzyme
VNRIGIIVTDPASYPPEDIDHDTPLLLAALRDRGATAEAAVWHDSGVDWAGFDLLVIRSPWDYMRRPADFVDWLDRVGAAGVRVLNDPRLIRWNMDKRYLADLTDSADSADSAGAGIAVVPTGYHHTLAAAGAALAAAGDGNVVVKPTVGAGSSHTGLFTASDPAAADLAAEILATGASVMVQPEVPELSAGKEKALYLVDGRLTHAIAKGALLAHGGGFRGGVYQEHPVTVPTTPAEEEFAARVLTAAARFTRTELPLYGRIDMVETGGSDGAEGAEGRSLVLLEAELFEPDFHLDLVPGVAGTLADAVLARMSDRPATV